MLLPSLSELDAYTNSSGYIITLTTAVVISGNQSAGVGVVGAEVSVAKNIVLFADAKIPFAETGAETFGSTRVGRATYNYGSGQGYNVTGSVGLGIKF